MYELDVQDAVEKEMQDLSAFYQAKFHSLDWQQVEELDTRYEGSGYMSSQTELKK